MKKMFLLVATLLCSSGYAQQKDIDDKIIGCIHQGGKFQQSANFRDAGLSPEEAFRTMKIDISGGKYGISIEFIKKAINLVYFNPDFTYARGDALAAQIRDDCMRDGKPRYQPLK